MKARLYIKTPWVFKFVKEMDIPSSINPIRIPIKEQPKAMLVLLPLTAVTFPIYKTVDFQLVSYDKINDEYIYVSNQ